jgi:3-hydroxybutyryl-CoA dehydratase
VYKLADLTIGMSLTEVNKSVIQENISLYAEASGDFNPIHLDPEFGKKMQLGGTIAHGMMILAYVSEWMAINFGTDWLTGGKLDIRFKTPAHPGDIISISGKIANIEKESNQSLVSCDVKCQNQQGQVVITGETQVRLKAL